MIVHTHRKGKEQASVSRPVAANVVKCTVCGRSASGCDVAAGKCQNCGALLLGDRDLQLFFEGLIRELSKEWGQLLA